MVYLRGVHTFSVYSTENGFIVIILGIPAVIVGLVAAIRPSSYDMGKSFYKNITCGPLKIAAKIERTRYTDITLTTLLLLQFNTIIVIYHFWSSHYSQSSSLSRSSSSSKTCMDIVINIINNYNSSTTRSLSSGKHHLYIISVFTDAG